MVAGKGRSTYLVIAVSKEVIPEGLHYHGAHLEDLGHILASNHHMPVVELHINLRILVEEIVSPSCRGQTNQLPVIAAQLVASWSLPGCTETNSSGLHVLPCRCHHLARRQRCYPNGSTLQEAAESLSHTTSGSAIWNPPPRDRERPSGNEKLPDALGSSVTAGLMRLEELETTSYPQLLGGRES